MPFRHLSTYPTAQSSKMWTRFRSHNGWSAKGVHGAEEPHSTGIKQHWHDLLDEKKAQLARLQMDIEACRQQEIPSPADAERVNAEKEALHQHIQQLLAECVVLLDENCTYLSTYKEKAKATAKAQEEVKARNDENASAVETTARGKETDATDIVEVDSEDEVDVDMDMDMDMDTASSGDNIDIQHLRQQIDDFVRDQCMYPNAYTPDDAHLLARSLKWYMHDIYNSESGGVNGTPDGFWCPVFHMVRSGREMSAGTILDLPQNVLSGKAMHIMVEPSRYGGHYGPHPHRLDHVDNTIPMSRAVDHLVQAGSIAILPASILDELNSGNSPPTQEGTEFALFVTLPGFTGSNFAGQPAWMRLLHGRRLHFVSTTRRPSTALLYIKFLVQALRQLRRGPQTKAEIAALINSEGRTRDGRSSDDILVRLLPLVTNRLVATHMPHNQKYVTPHHTHRARMHSRVLRELARLFGHFTADEVAGLCLAPEPPRINDHDFGHCVGTVDAAFRMACEWATACNLYDAGMDAEVEAYKEEKAGHFVREMNLLKSRSLDGDRLPPYYVATESDQILFAADGQTVQHPSYRILPSVESDNHNMEVDSDAQAVQAVQAVQPVQAAQAAQQTVHQEIHQNHLLDVDQLIEGTLRGMTQKNNANAAQDHGQPTPDDINTPPLGNAQFDVALRQIDERFNKVAAERAKEKASDNGRWRSRTPKPQSTFKSKPRHKPRHKPRRQKAPTGTFPDRGQAADPRQSLEGK